MIKDYKIFELVTSMKETKFQFKEFRGYYKHDLTDYRYIFKTNSGTKYKLDLKAIKEKNIIFNDDTELKDYSKTKIQDTNICYVISYTLFERSHLNYEEETNKNEHYELLSKIMYLLQDFRNKFENYNVFIFGTVSDKKLKFYSNYFKMFKIKYYESYSKFFYEDVLYLIF